MAKYIEKPDNTTIVVRGLPRSVAEALAHRAAAHWRSRNAEILHALTKYVDEATQLAD